MSPKELLYIEDALGHAKFLQTKCQQAASQLQDGELKSLATTLENKSNEMFSRLYQLM